MASKWNVVGQDRDEIPRIDIDRVRRESQWQVFTVSRRLTVILAAVALFAGTVSTSLTLGFFQQRRDLAEVTRNKQNLDRRAGVLTGEANSLGEDQTAWRKQNDREAQRHDWGDLMYAIAASVPPKVYLDDLDVQGRASSSPIVIEGSGTSVADVRLLAE